MIFNELKMADGDDRDENSPGQNQHNNGAPDLENLQIEEIEEPDNLEAVVSEYLALDGQLNQLDACLDSLEARNDDLVLKLKAFLQANQQPAESQEAGEDGGADGGSSLGGPSTSSSSKDSSKTDGAQAYSNCETQNSGTSS